jgi:phage/plasmid primase-like uncharacterized protein
MTLPKHVATQRLREACRGRWRTVLSQIGLQFELLNGKHHPCPKCGGTDRFRAFDDVDETGGVWCNQCHSTNNNDGFATVMWLENVDFKSAKQRIAECVDFARIMPAANQVSCKQSKSTVIADVATRHEVYSYFLSMLTLTASHCDNLKQRGLSDEAIELNCYRSWDGENSDRICININKNFAGKQCTVPGFSKLILKFPFGILIPVREMNGKIIALKVRLRTTK